MASSLVTPAVGVHLRTHDADVCLTAWGVVERGLCRTSEPQVSRDSDQQLLTRMVQGDEDALGCLYDRYAGELLGYAIVLFGGSKPRAEDLVHDLFIEAWNRASTYTPSRGSVRSWLYVRLRSRAIDRLRSYQRAAASRLIAFDDEQATGIENETVDFDMIRNGFIDLNDDQRQVLMLAYFRGLTQSEISTVLGIPMGTVKSRTSTALSKLRLLLDESHD